MNRAVRAEVETGFTAYRPTTIYAGYTQCVSPVSDICICVSHHGLPSSSSSEWTRVLQVRLDWPSDRDSETRYRLNGSYEAQKTCVCHCPVGLPPLRAYLQPMISCANTGLRSRPLASRCAAARTNVETPATALRPRDKALSSARARSVQHWQPLYGSPYLTNITPSRWHVR